MRAFIHFAIAVIPFATQAANCVDAPPAYEPVAQTFEVSCSPGQTIVDLTKAKSPVVKLNFAKDQEVSITSISGAKSSGGNGRNAQVCIWQSWNGSRPCGASQVSADGFNDWDGRAGCSVKVPRGVQYVRALQVNDNSDEQNTTLTIRCR